jgi:CRP-like cAMP-binding protein
MYGILHCGPALAALWVDRFEAAMDAPTKPLASNRLIAMLADEERERIEADLDVISLAVRQSVAEARKPFSHVYFPLSAVLSLVIELQDGGVVEVGTVGREGMVGIPLVHGVDESPTRVFCQIAGESARMKSAAFAEHMKSAPQFNRLLQRYAQSMMNQVSQTVACNRGHEIEQRLCRWLLMTHDRVGKDEFPLTQEFIADMLGVRRPSVTVVAGMLQKAGLIRYSRGNIAILNRTGLEAAACECYRLVKEAEERLIA